MEAENKESQGSQGSLQHRSLLTSMASSQQPCEGLKMNPDVIFRKPLRARKTMTPSSRKQVELLKNLHRPGRPGSSTYSVDNYVQLKMIETECLNYSSPEGKNPGLESKPASAKEPVAKLVVNSEISIYNGSPDVCRGLPRNGCGADANVKQFLNAGSLQDLLLTLYEKESGAPVSKPVEVCLYPKPAGRPLDHPGELPSSCTSVAPSLGKTEKAEEMPGSPAAVVLKQEHDDVQFQEGNLLPDDPLGKRRTSECKEEVSCKRITSSDETGVASSTQSDKSRSGLEKLASGPPGAGISKALLRVALPAHQVDFLLTTLHSLEGILVVGLTSSLKTELEQSVRCFVQSHIDNLTGDLDRRLQQLNERIDGTQCLRKHEEITNRIIKKISRLDRRVNSAVELQRAQLSKKANLPGAQPKTTILNAAQPLPGTPDDPPVPLKRQSVQPGEVPSKAARSSAKETCHSVETSGVQARNSADAQQRRVSSNGHTSVETLCAPKVKFLIDLTEEEDTNPGESVSVKADPPARSTLSKPPQPTAEPSKEIPALFPHLPPLPKIRLHPQNVNSFEGTLPPQKLELAVAQVQNPKGIALQWNIREVDPRCAPIESFHLFICLESEKKGAPSPWIKINEIKALPLPMACSLSQFAASGKCYFAMQSKDVFGRFGPFCDIQSISAA